MHEAKTPFAALLQTILIGLLLLSLVLIAQQWSKDLYKIGLVMLIVTALVQIPFGNVPPDSKFGPSMKFLVIGVAILAGVFAISIALVPTLLTLGRG